MSKRCLKEPYDPKQYAHQQVLDRQLHEAYRRKRAEMLFDYYTQDCGMAQGVSQYHDKGLLLIDGDGKKCCQEGVKGIGRDGFDSTDTAKEPKRLYIVHSSDSRGMEAVIPEPVQEQENGDYVF